MVIAGPGTGKTQILATRILNILSKTDAQPQNILCLTYTEAGATAMQKRLSQFMGADAESRLLMKAQRADHGVRNYRYDQTFRGIPVFGEGVVVSEDGAGNVRAMFTQRRSTFCETM